MNNMQIKIFILMILILNPAFGQKRAGSLNGDKILARTERGFSAIHDFVVKVQVEVNMERMQVPKMTSTMYYKEPDKIHFDSEGFLLVPREGINLNPKVLAENYDASFIRIDTIEGQSAYKLQLAAKEPKTKLRQLYAWIDPVRWTVVRLETIPYEGRTLNINFSYLHHAEKFWLPSKIVLTLGSTAGGEKTAEDSASNQTGQFPGFQRSMPRNGSVTIEYSDYKVNVGLEDSIFNEQKKN